MKDELSMMISLAATELAMGMDYIMGMGCGYGWVGKGKDLGE